MATTDGNRLAKRRRLRLIMYASGWKIKDCGDGASVMPVRVVDDFTSELPHAPRRAEALRNSAHGPQFSRWTGRKRNSSLSAMQRKNAHSAEKSGLLIQGFLSDGKIFGAGKCESLEGNGVELDPQSGRFRRKQITVLHFERLA